MTEDKHNVLVIGDSHIRIWSYIFHRRPNLLEKYRFLIREIEGLLALRLDNPEYVVSRHKMKKPAIPVFDNIIDKCKNYDYIMFSVGEVDCGYAMWYFAKKYNSTLDKQFKQALNNYKHFVIKYMLNRFKPEQIILMSVPLSIMEDQCDIRFIEGARAAIDNIPISERIEMTFKFNNELEKFANEFGFKFLDVNEDMYDSKTKRIKPEFRADNEFNHHLKPETSALIYAMHFALL